MKIGIFLAIVCLVLSFMALTMKLVLDLDNYKTKEGLVKGVNTEGLSVGTLVFIGNDGSVTYVSSDSLKSGVYGIITRLEMDTLYIKTK